MDHPGRDTRSLDPRQTRLQVPQARDQLGQGQDPVVVAQLQGADARGQLQDAGDGPLPQGQHQGMDPEAQAGCPGPGGRTPPAGTCPRWGDRPRRSGTPRGDGHHRRGVPQRRGPDGAGGGRRPGSGSRWPCAWACSRARAVAWSTGTKERTRSPGQSWPNRHRSAATTVARADEAPEAGAVRTQDHRHVPGEVHRADGIGVVVDIGGVQPRLAPVTALAQVGLGPIRRTPVRLEL